MFSLIAFENVRKSTAFFAYMCVKIDGKCCVRVNYSTLALLFWHIICICHKKSVSLHPLNKSAYALTYTHMSTIVKIINRSANDMPAYQTPQSAGMDLRANLSEAITLQPMERKLIPTGLYMELPAGYEAQVRPRSGMALKKGITVLNTPGTIDADYRGEIGIILINLSAEAVVIEPGERIAQMVIARYEQVEIEAVEVLTETERGAGGFGHSGVK